MGRLLGIAVREKSRAPMETLGKAYVDERRGIVGDFRGKGGSSGKRQVTVLTKEKWQAVCSKLDHSLPWTDRRANLFIEGIDFSEESVGRRLHIGEKVVLEITGEVSPCKRMDEAHPGLQEALGPEWRGGVACKVTKGGIIRVGNEVQLMKKRVFIVCPVRNVDVEIEEALRDYVSELEGKGIEVHWPPRDTNQDDPVGISICNENREAIYKSHEVHVWFDVNSQGSVFDMGMTFAFLRDMNKKIVIINKNEVSPTPHKSFQNVLLELEKASQ